MKFPTTVFLNNIRPKKIYKFATDKISTSIPHFFVCVLLIDREIIFVCCTSDAQNKTKRLIELRNLHKTLVPITADTEINGFTKQTWINCNSYFPYSEAEIVAMYEKNAIDSVGELTEIEMEQVILGLLASPTIDENFKNKIRDIF